MKNAAANANQAGFTGHMKDSETGLNYMQARYYDPVIGRFLSVDPMGMMDMDMNPGYFNRFAYTFNNPINLIDPDGMQVDLELKGRRIERTNLYGHTVLEIKDTKSDRMATVEGEPSESGGEEKWYEFIDKSAGHGDALLEGSVTDGPTEKNPNGYEFETLDTERVEGSFDVVVGKMREYVNEINEAELDYTGSVGPNSNTLTTGGFKLGTGRVPRTSHRPRSYPGSLNSPRPKQICESCP